MLDKLTNDLMLDVLTRLNLMDLASTKQSNKFVNNIINTQNIPNRILQQRYGFFVPIDFTTNQPEIANDTLKTFAAALTKLELRTKQSAEPVFFSYALALQAKVISKKEDFTNFNQALAAIEPSNPFVFHLFSAAQLLYGYGLKPDLAAAQSHLEKLVVLFKEYKAVLACFDVTIFRLIRDLQNELLGNEEGPASLSDILTNFYQTYETECDLLAVEPSANPFKICEELFSSQEVESLQLAKR